MKTKKIPFNIERAKAGAKIVTRSGLNVTIRAYIDDESYKYPIEAIIKDPTGRTTSKDTLYYSKEGRLLSSGECDLDLLIEEEVEEDDDYNPYKEVVKSISDMVEKYAELQSLEELKDFYNNVRVKCQDAFDYGKVCMINQDEEPDDNKPKFKVGDWVIDKQGMVQQITDVRENIIKHTYEYNTISYRFGILSYGYFNENVKGMRRWDINDAKPGDILFHSDTASNGIFIFKEIAQDKEVICYCDYDSEDGFCLFDEYHTCCWADSKILYPATKEQRDFLFRRMKEAGYEWDSDKKELKKIEEVKSRRMTRQELSWWLRDCPEEHREYMLEGGFRASADYDYLIDEADEEVGKVYIRKNGGEWQEPLIEE